MTSQGLSQPVIRANRPYESQWMPGDQNSQQKNRWLSVDHGRLIWAFWFWITKWTFCLLDLTNPTYLSELLGPSDSSLAQGSDWLFTDEVEQRSSLFCVLKHPLLLPLVSDSGHSCLTMGFSLVLQAWCIYIFKITTFIAVKVQWNDVGYIVLCHLEQRCVKLSSIVRFFVISEV